MNFLWVFLIFVLPLTFTKSQELTSLPNNDVINSTFGLEDQDHDNTVDHPEFTSLPNNDVINSTFGLEDQDHDKTVDLPEFTYLPNNDVFNSTFGLEEEDRNKIKQLPNLTSLPYYELANRTFSIIDENKNNIMERSEFLTYFNTFKMNENDTTVSKEWFIKRIACKELSDYFGQYMFAQYDVDHDGFLTHKDFVDFYKRFKRDCNDRVSHEEFIRLYDEWICNAKPGHNFT